MHMLSAWLRAHEAPRQRCGACLHYRGGLRPGQIENGLARVGCTRRSACVPTRIPPSPRGRRSAWDSPTSSDIVSLRARRTCAVPVPACFVSSRGRRDIQSPRACPETSRNPTARQCVRVPSPARAAYATRAPSSLRSGVQSALRAPKTAIWVQPYRRRRAAKTIYLFPSSRAPAALHEFSCTRAACQAQAQVCGGTGRIERQSKRDYDYDYCKREERSTLHGARASHVAWAGLGFESRRAAGTGGLGGCSASPEEDGLGHIADTYADVCMCASTSHPHRASIHFSF
ncbi:hypothetical protein B0H17DRAFT_649929 [Mycena rosella]|uniref:Uncharacterized protein n=1 Tax=Mycena rosella TaxID=1033263 RepID=A0AAD7GFI8_MYCRO|nr:hypothetical protein B0H17DRAFT_649929 [Mycena rosella]